MSEPLDLGFSEFVAKLISETFTAVTEAAMDQERRYAHLAAAAALPLEEFVATFVADEDVDRALLERFPPVDGSSTTSSAAAGQPYTPGSDGEDEQPPLQAELGIELQRGDVARGRISEKLARRIRDALALDLGRQEWEVARAVVQRGVPRVIVDAGHIMAKQTYQVTAASEEPPAPTAPRPVPTLSTSPLLIGRILQPTIRPDLLLRISSPKANGPTAKGDIYGEVEIRFKTVP